MGFRQRSFRQARPAASGGDEFSEDQFDGHNDIGDDSSAENGVDKGNSVENVSLGSLQAERVARKAKRRMKKAAMKECQMPCKRWADATKMGLGPGKIFSKQSNGTKKAEKLGCDEAACDLGCLYYLGRFPRDELKSEPDWCISPIRRLSRF